MTAPAAGTTSAVYRRVVARSIVVRQREYAPTLLNVVPVPEAMAVTIEYEQRSHLRGPAVHAACLASEVV